MGMILSICSECGTETDNLQSVTIKEGNNYIHKNVCQRCNIRITNEQYQKESNLLRG